jgi:hypothetical protein
LGAAWLVAGFNWRFALCATLVPFESTNALQNSAAHRLHVFQYNPQDFRFVFSIGGILPFLKGDYNSPVLLRYFSLRRLNIKGELIELPTCVRGDHREFEDTAATSAGFSSIFLGDRHISLMHSCAFKIRLGVSKIYSRSGYFDEPWRFG